MKLLYLDCSMGAAGDMLAAALLELLPDSFLERLNEIGIPHVRFARVEVSQHGIRGTHLRVTVHGEEEAHAHHHHHTLLQIEELVAQLNVSPRVRADILAIYRSIANAESAVHGLPVSEVHFHEVGALDAVADIAAVCVMLEELAPEKCVASPVHVGSGVVKCAHGVLPVPAPATALLLQNIPIYSTALKGELCTPTGAALLRHFVTEFGDMPTMRPQKIGYGMGHKTFDRPNCVRAMLADTPEDAVCELVCNLDDLTAEELGFACEQCFSAGALDVFTQPIGMKKSRAATMLHVLCRISDREAMLRCIFKHTTTLGIREYSCRRHTLARTQTLHETPFGTVRCKTAEGYGVCRTKAEYEDLARIACAQGLTLEEVRRLISK